MVDKLISFPPSRGRSEIAFAPYGPLMFRSIAIALFRDSAGASAVAKKPGRDESGPAGPGSTGVGGVGEDVDITIIHLLVLFQD